MSEGNWQNWDDKDYTDFIEEYYSIKLALAQVIARTYGDEAICAVFERIARPSVYLQVVYEKWKKKKSIVKPLKEAMEKIIAEKTVTDKWKPTRTAGTYMCSERDVTDGELAKAKDVKDESMWYSKPGEGYRWGLVFKKVKP